MRDTPLKITNPLIQLSHEAVRNNLVMIALGVPGSGKSSLAATLSKHFKGWKNTAHKGPPVVLSDLAWFAADRGATDPLKQHGYSVPQFDLPKFLADKPTNTIFDGLSKGMKALASMTPKPEWLIVDTLSAIDRYLVQYRAKQGGDKRQMYGMVLTDLMNVWETTVSGGTNVLFLCHTKSLEPMDDTGIPERSEQLRTAAGGTIVPDITGKGALMFKMDASLQVAVMTRPGRPKPGSKAKTLERYVETMRVGNTEVKNRFELLLDAEEDPDFGKMLKKIGVR